ncbi:MULTISPECIES: peptidoglycan-binding protein [unclassified Bradyrhizobium]|uniref:peptidoglycan-binding protein n=1 Tax=unclassified Bradyrhizobium TaxID=2631580 RepID=UPI002916C29D|nr:MULTISPECIES: peptidoglycan-binding protein [unclassified Bradyrhizobium]
MTDLHGISQETFDDGVGYEVTSRAVYEKRYRRPTWPNLNSGVTVGIGYDLGQASRKQIAADWESRISDGMLMTMLSCAGVTGKPARELALRLQDEIDIPWQVAIEVYAQRDLPRYTAMCRAHLPGYDALAPHCKGALFSLVLNRGPSFDKPGPRYAEMRDIKAAIAKGDLARVPALLRSMKRIWKGTPDERGLSARREKEAMRWEQGLADKHPEQHAKLASQVEITDPDVVAHVQQQLKQLGYYQVGSADGSLTPKGKTEAAILAFRHHEGLPLSPAIDDDLTRALAHAQPPDIAEIRANATVDDLRAQGSHTIAFTDQAKAWAGRLFGSSGVLTGGGLLALITDKATQLKSAQDAVGALGITPQMFAAALVGVLALALLAACGLGIWYVAHRIEQQRLADYHTGKHP